MSYDREKMAIGPGVPSYAWECMIPRWDKINAVLGGTETMRLANEAYLPKHTEETQLAYEERLKRSVFTNVTDQTLDTWTGKPFSEKIRVNDDVPEQIVSFLPDIDLCGNELQVFARNWFRKGLAKAFAHVLVEYPRVDPEQVQTRADDKQAGLRPYLVLIEPESVLGASSEIRNGQEIITQLRVFEMVLVDDPENEFVKKRVPRIRVYDIGRVRLYEWQKVDGKKDEIWVQIDEWESDFKNTVPLVTFYAHREEFMVGKPPVEDLADLNIAHWQSASDQTAILTVTRFPQLAVSGAMEKDSLVIGPNRVIHLTDSNAKVYYVEHNGAAIAAGENDLKRLQEQMHTYGTQFLQRQPGRVTATARTLDTAEATSALQDAAIRFNDALNQALQYMAEWIDEKDGGTVAVQTNFGITEGSAESLQTLQQTRLNGDISREQYVRELTQRGVLSDLFDPKENANELVTEEAQQLKREKELQSQKQPVV